MGEYIAVRISVEPMRVGGNSWRTCFKQGRDCYKEVLGGWRRLW